MLLVLSNIHSHLCSVSFSVDTNTIELGPDLVSGNSQYSDNRVKSPAILYKIASIYSRTKNRQS